MTVGFVNDDKYHIGNLSLFELRFFMLYIYLLYFIYVYDINDINKFNILLLVLYMGKITGNVNKSCHLSTVSIGGSSGRPAKPGGKADSSPR
jgi:hypothetical protein